MFIFNVFVCFCRNMRCCPSKCHTFFCKFHKFFSLGNFKFQSMQSCRPDNIHGRVLKELNEQVAPILTSIFFKITKIRRNIHRLEKCKRYVCVVAPAFKKSEKYKAVIYHPISLTCICCKIIEHTITSNIMTYLENNNIL